MLGSLSPEELASLHNPKVSAAKNECLHGAPRATDSVVMSCFALQEQLEFVRSCSDAAVRLQTFLSRNTRHATASVHKVLLSMATDAALEEDFHNARKFAIAAGCLRSFLEAGAVTVSNELRDLERSDWHIKRYLALECKCRCFSARFAASCAQPGCTARHGVDGVSLHACSACTITFYCGAAHQEAHWAEHKTQCKKKGGSAPTA